MINPGRSLSPTDQINDLIMDRGREVNFTALGTYQCFDIFDDDPLPLDAQQTIHTLGFKVAPTMMTGMPRFTHHDFRLVL